MNVNNWGVDFVFNTGFNLSGFTLLQIIFTRPDGTTFTKSSPAVSCPNVNLETTAGLFEAQQYAQYTTVPGDINQVGMWSARVEYTDLNQFLTSDSADFEIFP